MVPAFVIGLREGLEAALIVGIIAAFLVAAGGGGLLRRMWLGVAAAAAVCLAVGIGLRLLQQSLPQREQEMLETVIALVAAVVVTWMIVWMRRHAPGLRRELERGAAAAIATGSAAALVGMAFFAVLREGLETAVFLVAVFDGSDDPLMAGLGAVAGLVVSAAIGLGVYRGGVRLDLQRFFRVTGVVLVLVAAGLVASATHTAHEAGWLDALQGQAIDLSGVVAPGSVRAALVTGVLGIQPRPVSAEVLAWCLYAIPMALFVLWPVRRRARRDHEALAADAVAA